MPPSRRCRFRRSRSRSRLLRRRLAAAAGARRTWRSSRNPDWLRKPNGRRHGAVLSGTGHGPGQGRPRARSSARSTPRARWRTARSSRNLRTACGFGSAAHQLCKLFKMKPKTRTVARRWRRDHHPDRLQARRLSAGALEVGLADQPRGKPPGPFFYAEDRSRARRLITAAVAD